MNVVEILQEVSKLSPQEKEQIIKALKGDKTGDAMLNETDNKKLELYRRLMAKGMLKRIPARTARPPELVDFKPIEVEGKPVSETIIEERR